MKSIYKFKYVIVLLFALNCVLLCSAQGGNGGWGGSSGGNGAPGGGSGGGAPGAPGGGYYGHDIHSSNAAANMGLAHVQWIMTLMPFTLLLKYVCNM